VLLETDPNMVVVAEAADGLEAVEAVEQYDPDVILMDLRMPGMDGISAVREILHRKPDQAVIILTTFNEDALIREALTAGARGYLLKDMDRDTLLRTVTAAARGEALLDSSLLSRALSSGGGAGPAPERGAPQATSPLTERESEVLEAIAGGHTSRSAAEELGVSERTIKAHLTSVFDKFGVDTRAAAIAFAAERGWLYRNSRRG
jgi:NarL family two-component system response regulator YdfI